MVPFFIFYSMFGFQRVGDLIWQAADARTRGFLLGATAGRTTLLGEGLQHQDGHSLLHASTVPVCEAYDPAFAYEMATIIRKGLERMYPAEGDGDDVFYYLTLYNENYSMPARPDVDDLDEQIMRGLYRWAEAPDGPSHRATILFSGTAHAAARKAQAELAEHWDVAAELWSATSFKRLRDDALEIERWNRLHADEDRKIAYVAERLAETEGPVVAVTDFMAAVPDMISRWLPDGRGFTPLGTDGFGRSDTRESLRRFFETDAEHVVVAVLSALAASGDLKPETVDDAIRQYDLDPDAPNPRTAWPEID
jgi:pyruvate dehydrogenase E1 component